MPKIAGRARERRAAGPTSAQTDTSGKGTTMRTTDDKLIAINVLLEPDRTMTDKSKSLNARLRETYRPVMSWTLRICPT